jgi:hypothetical protein
MCAAAGSKDTDADVIAEETFTEVEAVDNSKE